MAVNIGRLLGRVNNVSPKPSRVKHHQKYDSTPPASQVSKADISLIIIIIIIIIITKTRAADVFGQLKNIASVGRARARMIGNGKSAHGCLPMTYI